MPDKLRRALASALGVAAGVGVYQGVDVDPETQELVLGQAELAWASAAAVLASVVGLWKRFTSSKTSK